MMAEPKVLEKLKPWKGQQNLFEVVGDCANKVSNQADSGVSR